MVPNFSLNSGGVDTDGSREGEADGKEVMESGW
jgi:hypothetical protein